MHNWNAAAQNKVIASATFTLSFDLPYIIKNIRIFLDKIVYVFLLLTWTKKHVVQVSLKNREIYFFVCE